MKNDFPQDTYTTFKKLVKKKFDRNWYLDTYPDVADNGVDPLQHYLINGRYESRWPYQLTTLKLEILLYEDETQHGSKAIREYFDKDPFDNLEVTHAAWLLARWHASYCRWSDVLYCMSVFNEIPIAGELIPHLGPILIEFTALIETGDESKAKQIINIEIEKRGELPNLLLAKSSISKGNDNISLINKIYKNEKLLEIKLEDSRTHFNLDNLDSKSSYADSFKWHYFHIKKFYQPCVTVIFPTYNADKTIQTALQSIQKQTWHNLDIIIIDDASTDNTFEITNEHALNDKRICVIRNDYNQGAYTSRNKALKLAKGKFITTHDSDDWSHPQKIELQANKLLSDNKLMATTSHWVRCTPEMIFSHWFLEDSWIYRNVSSLMFRRKVFKQIGYWDRVRVGADTEYIQRIQKVYGLNSIKDVMPGIPLSFGRLDPKSLSQDNITHLRTSFKGLRRNYRESWFKWHSEVKSPKGLYLSANPNERPFPIPNGQEVPPQEDIISKYYKLLKQSELVNIEWFLNTYPDIADSRDDPVMNYLIHGGYEGRDPGPDFTSSGYTFKYLKNIQEIINPLAHYLLSGKLYNNETLPLLEGKISSDTYKKNILVCAHTSGREIFGAERSFLDVLEGLTEIGLNVIVTLPAIGNEEYLHEILERVVNVKILPYSWWKYGKHYCQNIKSNFEAIINQHEIDAVYANTIMLWEPLLAAKSCDIKSIVHIRELPEQDQDLCKTLNAEPETIRQYVTDLADQIIANSEFVLKFYSAPDKTTIVHNIVSSELFDLSNKVDEASPTIGMISSNIPKKGLDDFLTMSSHLYSKNSKIRCLLIGPENEYTEKIRKDIEEGIMPNNIFITGYVNSQLQVLEKTNIVVNLSQFQESFGRTVLEAMAASRAVIAYEWGALPELIRDGENGYLIPYRNIQLLVDKVLFLCEQPERIIKMGEVGRDIAMKQYNFDNFKLQLKQAVKNIIL